MITGVGRARAEETLIRYEVVAAPAATDLQIEADFPASLGPNLVADPDAAAFIDGVSRAESGRWIVVPKTGGVWSASECQRRGCHIRYVFHLRAAARAADDPDTAAERGGAIVAPASTWLVRPERLPPGGLRGRLHVTVVPPLVFVTGLPPVPHQADTYAVALLPFFVSPYAAFGRFESEELQIGGTRLWLAVETPALKRDLPRIRTWVLSAARAVSTYFGRFPVDRALVLAVPQASGLHGQALGGGGATVLLQMAPGADLADRALDWQAAHEMVHLAVPEMSRSQLWLTEGLATYIEPLARSMTGELPPASVWGDMVSGLPKGLPEPGDRGLDRTHTWGRTYWGGALFAFVADLEIRKATHDKESLATALKGALDAGGDARVQWPVERYLSACDGALEKPILADLYQRMARQPMDVDLQALWRDLGVSVSGRRVHFDEHAPEAAVRRSMTK